MKEELAKLYTLFESGSEANIKEAVDAFEANPDYLAAAEKRYLAFIRLRQGESASLRDWYAARLKQEEIDLLSGSNFDGNYLSFAYLNEAQCKVAVQFMASLVLSHLNLSEFEEAAKQAENGIKLFDNVYEPRCKAIRAALEEQASIYAEGYWSKLLSKFLNLQPERVLFESTSFNMPDGPALRGFVFFVNLNHPWEVYFDICQSYVPELSPYFWILPNVPDSSWLDTPVALPKSFLSFSRKTRYKEGDRAPWISVQS